MALRSKRSSAAKAEPTATRSSPSSANAERPSAALPLFQAILDAPEDDDPRLVYADWLLERGDERGEFIQIQCALGDRLHGARGLRGRRRKEYDMSPEELIAREKTLLKKHQRQWLAPFRAFVRTWVWKRGFVESVEADGKTFLDGAETVFANTPLEHAALTAMKPPLLERLAQMKALRALRSLHLGQQRIGPKEATVFHSENLVNVRKLDLWGNPLGDDGALVLSRAARLDALTSLGLASCKLTARGVDALSRAPFFPRLTRLELRYNDGLGPLVGEALVRGESLVELSLGSNQIGDDGLAAIAGSPTMKNLETLELYGNDITERGVEVLVKSPHLARLKRVRGLIGSCDELEEGTRGAKMLEERFPE